MKIPYGTQLGDYRVTGFIGAGGMGTVYRAEHLRLGYAAALKLMNDADPRYAARFQNEARLLAGLRHPHIARFYDFFEARGHACLAMELVEGETVSERVRARGGPLEETEALRLLRDVTDALVYLHGRGILHRDLKSANLMCTPTGGVKVLDFGIARLDGSTRLTAAGQVIGTPQYLAPEQLRGAPPSPHTDLWALGVMLYEWTTGHLPFEGAPDELYRRIVAVDYVDPRALNPALSEPARTVVDRCLRARPSARPASAQALLDTLEALLAAPGPRPRPGAFGLGSFAGWTRAAAGLRDRLPAGLPAGLRADRARAFVAGVVGTAAVAAGLLALGRGEPAGPPPAAPPLWTAPARPADDPDAARLDPVRRDARGDGRPDAAAAEVDVTIAVFGPPAEVYRDGRRVGRTPYHLRAPTGARVDLVLRRDGHRPHRVRVQVPATDYTFTETLEPLR